jgi:hypothetical protein
MWRVAIRREGPSKSIWVPSSDAKVCGAHFRLTDFREPVQSYREVGGKVRRLLRHDAVPSIFPHSAPATEAAKARKERLRDRERKLQADDPSSKMCPSSLSEMPGSPLEDLGCTSFVTDIGEAEEEPLGISDCSELEKGVQTDPAQAQTAEKEVETDASLLERGPMLSMHKIRENDDAIQFYTGLRSYSHFLYVLKCLGPAAHHLDYKCRDLGSQDQFFLALIKLRLSKEDMELSILFRVSRVTAGRIFLTWLNFMFYQFQELDLFLPRDVIDVYMPKDFKKKFPSTRIILDATEIKIQKPENPPDQSATWSTYKHSNTLKTMIGVTPRGLVSYVSSSYGGSCSDRQIIERSSLVQEPPFAPKDSIMADRGIMVQDIFACQDVQVNTPETMRGKNQLDPETVIKDRRIASKRVHVERVIGLAKTYKILAGDLDHSKTPYGSRIIFVCFALCNFRENIMSQYA